jgi:hypothetical protein
LLMFVDVVDIVDVVDAVEVCWTLTYLTLKFVMLS